MKRGVNGRHSYLVVRQGFKPCRGCQTLSGRFDSGCLPPRSSWSFAARFVDADHFKQYNDV
ncbi:hypothetical protein PCAR4_200005 [Paraburkholderia caribensis]|nr:hypothetical protein PCAR4_200005 [Paraburkholderia caribensis]